MSFREKKNVSFGLFIVQNKDVWKIFVSQNHINFLLFFFFKP